MYYSEYDRPAEVTPRPDEAAVTRPAPSRRAPGPRWPKILALVLVCVLMGSLAGVGGALLIQRAGRTAAPEAVPTTVYRGGGSPAVVTLTDVAPGQVLTAAQVYAANVNSTVGIVTQAITTNVWGQKVSAAAAGSGFVLTENGYIVTNAHVVEGATSVTVKFKNGDEYPATVVGSEADNDVAVLKIEVTGLTPVQLGTSADLVVGEDVAAIGNPLGEMTFSMTRGIVSALDKALTMSDGTVINVLQTDAPINAGNSGGPLFNMYGQVVGITNAKYSNNGSSKASIEGICFAIPIDDVKDMLTDIMEHGYVTGKPYMGLTLSTANASEAARYGRSGGAYVQSVVPGAAADKAGLKQGDIITAVDGQSVDGHAALITIKNSHRAGDTLSLTVDREGRFITVSITLDEQKPDDLTAPSNNSQGSGGQNGQSGQGGYGYVYPYSPGFGFGSDPFSWPW